MFGRHLLGGEQGREDGHQRHPAANAQQSGEEADDGAGEEVGKDPGHGARGTVR
jgi:hypothetical protein